MGKMQSSLQKAIERSKDASERKASGRARPSDSARRRITDVADRVLKKFQMARPVDDVMEESGVVSAVDDRAAKTAYNVLRTRVLQRLRSNDWHSIVVTSAGPGDGKTVTATNLAMSLARDVNQSVILVDLDLTRSSVAKYLGIGEDTRAGIGDYLLERAELSEILYSPEGIDGLSLVPNREPVENPSDHMGSPRLKALVSQLRGEAGQTIVIYDMPPVLACDDVLAFCPNIDAVLLVIAQGRTEREDLEKAMAILSDYEILGVVLNMSDEFRADNENAYY